MGWNIRPVNGRFAVAHGGSQPETRTFLLFLPVADLAIAVACNYEDADPGVYAERVYEIVMGEPVNPKVYTEDRLDAQVYAALSDVFAYGVAHFDRYGAPAASAPDSLGRAFAYFGAAVARSALQSDFDAAVERIQEGRHPSAGSPFVVLGAHMAAALARERGDKRLEKLHARGPIQLFADYVAHCRAHPEVPAAQRLERAFEEFVLGWEADWKRTWTGTTQALAVSSFRDAAGVVRKLKESFQGTRVRPDFTADFSDVFGSRLAGNDVVGAQEAAEAAKALYPKAGLPWVDAGVGRLAAGDAAGARDQIRRALEFEPQGAGSASALNRRASALQRLGRSGLALAFLEIARELHPADANLCDSTGEILLAIGQTEEAIAWYEKALEIDPRFENARRMLDKIHAGVESARGR
jgi:tetratricopeptide (TPR) repeat protein